MRRKKKKLGTISTFLGPESSIEGTIEFKGVVRLDGKMTGRIIGREGTVIVGEHAVIHADMIVAEAVIMGEVIGTIDAKDRIEVNAPGCVDGDIYAPVISIDSGAAFNGNCGMKARDIDVKRFEDSPGELPEPEKNRKK